MPRKVTKDHIQQWKKLRDRGYSYRTIGEKTGWNEDTVGKYLQEHPPEEAQETGDQSLAEIYTRQSRIMELETEVNAMKKKLENKASTLDGYLKEQHRSLADKIDWVLDHMKTADPQEVEQVVEQVKQEYVEVTEEKDPTSRLHSLRVKIGMKKRNYRQHKKTLNKPRRR